MAQLVSASPCHGEGRGFESRQGRQHGEALAAFWPGSSVGMSVRLKSGRSAVRSRPWPRQRLFLALFPKPSRRSFVGGSAVRERGTLQLWTTPIPPAKPVSFGFLTSRRPIPPSAASPVRVSPLTTRSVLPLGCPRGRGDLADFVPLVSQPSARVGSYASRTPCHSAGSSLPEDQC